MNASLLLGLALTVSAPESAGSLVGEWVAVSVVVGGQAERVADGSRLTVTPDGKFLMKDGQDGKVTEMAYTADPKPAPAHINVRDPEEKDAAPGIYKIDGESLTICVNFGPDRPREFSSPAKSAVMLMTFKRAKKG